MEGLRQFFTSTLAGEFSLTWQRSLYAAVIEVVTVPIQAWSSERFAIQAWSSEQFVLHAPSLPFGQDMENKEVVCQLPRRNSAPALVRSCKPKAVKGFERGESASTQQSLALWGILCCCTLAHLMGWHFG